EWVHVQLHQQKGMISLSPPTICNSAHLGAVCCPGEKEKVKTPEKMPHSLAFVDSTSELAQLA
ncbi:hypothetical protein ABEK98_28630, partial [Klebsiella pneumoniae]